MDKVFNRMPRMILYIVAAAAYISISLADAVPRRPPTLNDFFKLSEFGVVRPSPDGHLLVVEVRRPRIEQGAHAADDTFDFQRSDLWLIHTISGRVERLTDGTSDGSWHWGPIWAPNGQKLAFLSYVPGGDISWSVWNRADGRIRSLPAGQRSVALGANFGSKQIVAPDGRISGAWTDDDHLITVLRPDEGGRDAFGGEVEPELAEPTRHMSGLWQKAERGETSVTVWDSRALKVCALDDELVRISARDGHIEKLMGGAVRAVSMSPSQQYAAVMVATDPQGASLGHPAERHELAFNNYNSDSPARTALYILDLRRSKVMGPVAGTSGLNFLSSRRFPRWSNGGLRFAVPARQLDGSNWVYLVRLPGLEVEEVAAESALGAEVLSEVIALSEQGSELPRFKHRELFPDGEPKRGQIPGDVERLSENRIGVFLRGALTVLDSRGEVVGHYDGVQMPTEFAWQSGHPLDFVVTNKLDDLGIQDLDTRSERVRLTTPRREARLAAFITSIRAPVFIAESDDGTYLWVGQRLRPPVIRLNEHLQELERPLQIIVDYRSANGEVRKALLLAPPGYKKGVPQATIVDGYPSVMIEGLPAPEARLSYFYYPRHLLVSAGYLVLIPSVPWPRSLADPEAMDLVTKPVLEALDAAVEQGYADPKRLGFRGHSYGGYMALSLATRTDRFQAIVAAAAYADLIAHYDRVMPGGWSTSVCGSGAIRRGADELEDDGGLFRMPSAPWALENLDRYIRNSPYFQVKSVHTPILLIHGDLDAVPDADPQSMFMALLRRGVPVEFAHYWGEAHNFRSLGNIRDAWERTLAWFATYVQRDTTSTAAH